MKLFHKIKANKYQPNDLVFIRKAIKSSDSVLTTTTIEKNPHIDFYDVLSTIINESSIDLSRYTIDDYSTIPLTFRIEINQNIKNNEFINLLKNSFKGINTSGLPFLFIFLGRLQDEQDYSFDTTELQYPLKISEIDQNEFFLTKIVVHKEESAKEGHFIIFIREIKDNQPNENDEWTLINDSVVAKNITWNELQTIYNIFNQAHFIEYQSLDQIEKTSILYEEYQLKSISLFSNSQFFKLIKKGKGYTSQEKKEFNILSRYFQSYHDFLQNFDPENISNKPYQKSDVITVLSKINCKFFLFDI